MPATTRAVLLALATASLGDAARIRHDISHVTRRPKAPKLCDKQIVHETCVEAFGLPDEQAELTAQSIIKVLSATESSVKNLWKASGMPAQVPCKRLCQEVVDTLDLPPPASDVGCYIISGQMRCDLDLSPGTIANNVKSKKDMPDFHDKDKVALLQRAANITAMDKPGHSNKGKGPQAGEPLPQAIDYDTKVLIRRIANLFRIYPPTLTTVGESADLGEVEEIEGAEEEKKAEMAGALVEGGKRASWGDRRRAAAPTPTPPPATPAPATPAPTTTPPRATPAPTPPPTTTTTTIAAVNCKDSTTYRDPSFADPCTGWAGYECTGHAFSAALIANCPAACNACSGPPSTRAPTTAPAAVATLSWQVKLAQVNAMAIAYVGTAIRKSQARQTDMHLKKWYGNAAVTDASLTAQITRVLNGVDAMLGNVEFVMGPECSPNTYAYVYPQAYTCADSEVSTRACTKNNKGQFVFYICIHFSFFFSRRSTCYESCSE